MKARTLLGVYFVCSLPLATAAQETRQSMTLYQYLDRGKTIVIAKCLSVGRLKANLQTDMQVQVLYVLKGAEILREITVVSRFAMREGETYLLRTENETDPKKNYFYINSLASVVPVFATEDLDKLKKLPIKTQVVRIFNQRKSDVDDEIRRLSYERDVLAKVLEQE